MDIETAGQKCRNAGIAACIQGAITLAVICFAIFGGAVGGDEILQYFNDPYYFIDVVIIFVLAAGLFWKSRTAAILLLIYFIASKVAYIADTGRVSGGVLSLIFIYFYYQGIIGAFAYTRLRRKENPKYRKKPILLNLIAAVGVLLLTGLVGLGVVMSFSDSPSTAIEEGKDLSEADLQWLRENDVIEADETIDLFYSYGVFSIGEGGNLLTNRRVVSYFNSEEDSELEVHFAAYDEVVAINLQQKGDFLSDTMVEVVYGSQEDQGWFYLVLSAENAGDQKFIELLERRSTVKLTLDVATGAG